MAFKTDNSFLRYLTMGAIGVRSTMDVLERLGFEPIELERYSSSNKIWSTKVKRLRLPDILCVRTGVRVEVRAKSDLKVRMSDAPDNPERRWDVGLRDTDLVAFVACSFADEDVRLLGSPIFFSASDLRSSVDQTRLGPPKSASEGAERDREWPSTVPSEDGEVLSVDSERLTTRLESGRRQTYRLKDKFPYVSAGERFFANASIIAGAIRRLAPMEEVSRRIWDPRSALEAPDPVDRYAAAKAVPRAPEAGTWGEGALLSALKRESDERVALELSASGARLEATFGMEGISSVLWGSKREDLRMEAVLILSELSTPAAAAELERAARAREFERSEVRQAAVWGLGKAGCRSYITLLDFLGDADDGVALHAIVGLGADVSVDIIRKLVALLRSGTDRQRAAASGALRVINSREAVAQLVGAYRSGGNDPWLLATLGRFPGSIVREALSGDPLLTKVEPLLILGEEENWLARSTVSSDFNFLLKQRL